MTLQHAYAVISLASDNPMWFRDADDWYEAMARIMRERAPA